MQLSITSATSGGFAVDMLPCSPLTLWWLCHWSCVLITLSKLAIAQILPTRPGGVDGVLHAQDIHPEGMRTNTASIFLATACLQMYGTIIIYAVTICVPCNRGTTFGALNPSRMPCTRATYACFISDIPVFG